MACEFGFVLGILLRPVILRAIFPYDRMPPAAPWKTSLPVPPGLPSTAPSPRVPRHPYRHRLHRNAGQRRCEFPRHHHLNSRDPVAGNLSRRGLQDHRRSFPIAPPQIFDSPGQRSKTIHRAGQRNTPAAAYKPIRRLQACDSAPGCRIADPARRFRADRTRTEACRDSYGRPLTILPDHSRIPGISCRGQRSIDLRDAGAYSEVDCLPRMIAPALFKVRTTPASSLAMYSGDEVLALLWVVQRHRSNP